MRFPTDASKPFVADASVIINLNATAYAAEILQTLKSPLLVTENARMELEAGLRSGHNDAEKLRVLIRQGAVRVVKLGAAGSAIYDSLIEGAAAQTLDDGEAATVAFGVETASIALIDERKARSICAARFPQLAVRSTAGLLVSDEVRDKLGGSEQVEAILNALRGARMRVPEEHVGMVVSLIGEENAASCTSLPKRVKRNAGSKG